MGRATIVSGGTDGRYTIALDVGDARRDLIVTAATQNVANLDAAILAKQTQVNELAAIVETRRVSLEIEIDKYVSTYRDDLNNINSLQVSKTLLPFVLEQKAYTNAKLVYDNAARDLEALKLTRADAARRLTEWQALPLTENREAWCADFTESGTGPVGTIEIPGESDLILVKPGAPAPTGSDGALLSRSLMSPEQAFWNAAALPGWQKYNPTFRRGTLTAINTDNHTGSVSLAAATSSAQRLNVNQGTSLTNVPITYMTCHSNAFEIGDQVVVMFDGQNWESPRVIGFVDNPRPCEEFSLFYSGLGLSETQLVYRGRDAEPVTATTPYVSSAAPYGGAALWFGWNDGIVSLTRHDTNVQASANHLAIHLILGGIDIGFYFSSGRPDGPGTDLKWRKGLFIGNTANLTLSLNGVFESGWLDTEAEARAFMVGTIVTGTTVYRGVSVTAQFIIAESSLPDPATDLRLISATPLYAVGP